MEEKFSFKLVQNGQTKLSRQIRTGAGVNGQALVVKAEDAAHYQVVNLVTLTSPAKMQLKRKGDDLQLSLPGGDADMPDVIIQGYFAAEGNVLKGISQNGEWMSYDTSVFLPKPPNGTDKPAKNLNPDSPVAIGLADPPLGLMSKFDSPMGLAAMGGGVVVFGSLGHGSGSGSSSSAAASSSTDSFAVFKSYAGSSAAGAVAPTLAQYTTAGVTVPTVDSVTPANVLAALNQVVSGKTAADVTSKAQLQALADALKTSWALIIAEANGSTADTTPNSSPTATDYLNVGVVVGKTTKVLDLMNSALTELSAANVDSSAKIKDMATAADNLMKVAAGTSGASVSSSDLLSLGIKINGNNSGITALEADAFTKNLANLMVSLGKAADTTTANTALKSGEAVDTIAEVQALFSLQAMRSYNDDTATTKTQTAPGVIDYTHIGIKSYASLADQSEPSRIALDASNFGVSNLQTTLNSALDNQDSGTALTKTVVQTMVDAYYKVLKEAASTSSNTGFYVNDSTYDPSLTNYTSLGITHSDAAKTALATGTDGKLLTLLNSAIGKLSASAVDTTSEIQALEKAAENVLALGLGSGDGKATSGVTYTSDSDWLSGFTSLGVAGINANNLAGIKTAIDTADSANNGAPIDTVQELQAIVSLYRINDYAADDTIYPIPTLSDYQAILANQGTSLLINGLSSNLSAYNDAVRTETVVSGVHTTFSETQMKDLIVSFDKLLKYADGDKDSALDPAPSLTDLKNIGLGNGWTDAQLKSVLGDASNGLEDSGSLENTKNLALFVDVIGGKTKDAVNSIKELNDLAVIINRIVSLENKIANGGSHTDTNNYKLTDNGGQISITELQSLGLDVTNLTTVYGTTQTNRLYDVFDSIIRSNSDTISSLKTLQEYINNTSGINA